MKRVVSDANRCSGCRLCEMVCSYRCDSTFSPSSSRIRVMREDSLGMDLPIVCWHCDPCSAMESCPSGALERNEDGLVSVNEKECVGCGECSEHCVIGAVELHPERKVPLICDHCKGEPQCVKTCPTEALSFVESAEQQPKLPDQIVEDTLKRWGATV